VKRGYLACPMALFALSVAVCLAQRGPDTTADSIAITGAKAYLQPGQPPVENATILVVKGKILAAAAGLAVPLGMRRIDAKGRMVTPGLMNSASQLGLVETGTADTTDSAITTGPFGASFDVQYALNPNSTLLPIARADGLTRAMVVPVDSATPPFDGLGAVLRLSEGPDILDLPQAAVVATVGGMVAPKSGGSRSAQWMLIRSALDAARRKEAIASSTYKEISHADRSTLLSPLNVEALMPVLKRKVPLVIVAYRESDLRQVVALVDDYKIRVVIIGADEGWRVAELLASRKIAVVLDPYASTPATYDQIGARLDNAALLDRAGVIISFKAAFVHVSYNAGIAIREGAGIAVANGLPWSHALKALTVNPAETWGIADHYGTLQPGQDADLVIWDGDAFEPMSTPAMVLVRGRQVSLETRQTDLEKRYHPNLAGDPVSSGYR
jgi:imidazolonepropionase-like amidohydrolase